MKRNFNWILLAALSLAVSFTAVSCNDDGDDITKTDIVGEWYLSNINGFLYIEGVRADYDESFTEDESESYFVFNADGTGIQTEISSEGEDFETTHFTWSIKGTSLTIKDNTSTTAKIKKLTSTTLRLQEKGTNEYGKFEYNVTLTKTSGK